jgi:hypothetical protein
LRAVLFTLLLLVALEFALPRLVRLWDVFRLVLDGGVIFWDFQDYYVTGYLVRAGLGDQIYDLAAHSSWAEQLTGSPPESDLGFVYPPFFAVILAPLGWLSHLAAFRLWFALNSVVFLLLGLVLWRLAAPAPAWQRALLLACILSLDAVYYVMAAGQVSGLITLILATSLLLLRRGHEGLAGSSLALAAVKPQLVVGVLLLLAVRARWRALVAFSLTAGALSLAALPFVGLTSYLELLQFLANQSGAGGLAAVNYTHMHNWRAFMANFGLDSVGLAYGGAFVLLALIALAGALWAWRAGPARGSGYGNQEWAVALMFSLLITPHLWTQDLVLLALVGALFLSQLAQASLDLRHHLGTAALLLAGYVILAEAWNLTRQDISVTVFPLLVAFLWTCLRRWGSEETTRVEPQAVAAATVRP